MHLSASCDPRSLRRDADESYAGPEIKIQSINHFASISTVEARQGESRIPNGLSWDITQLATVISAN